MATNPIVLENFKIPSSKQWWLKTIFLWTLYVLNVFIVFSLNLVTDFCRMCQNNDYGTDDLCVYVCVWSCPNDAVFLK